MRSNLSRREFHKLTSAALGGMVTGTMLGCSSEKISDKQAGGAATGAAAGGAMTVAAAIHACRGLNDCKGQGAGGKNDCAGQGQCATVKHDCAQQNDCKHQGGCGAAPGYNDCKQQGGCAVPMAGNNMWEKARARFEQLMKEEGKQYGAAPAAKAS